MCEWDSYYVEPVRTDHSDQVVRKNRFFIRLKILVILGRRISSPAIRFSCEKSDQKMGKSAF